MGRERNKKLYDREFKLNALKLLEKGEVSIERNEEEGYVFISTFFHCILQRENDREVINFIEQAKLQNLNISDLLVNFESKIRIKKNSEIEMRL